MRFPNDLVRDVSKLVERLARAYTNLEERIAELSEQEELGRIRPELDGKDIMTSSALPRAAGWKRPTISCSSCGSREARPGREQATQELLRWAAEAGITPPEPERPDPGIRPRPRRRYPPARRQSGRRSRQGRAVDYQSATGSPGQVRDPVPPRPPGLHGIRRTLRHQPVTPPQGAAWYRTAPCATAEAGNRLAALGLVRLDREALPMRATGHASRNPPAPRPVWLTDLLDLAMDSMSPDAKADVARQALQDLRPADGAGRKWEVSLGSRIVTAGSAQEAAEKARRRWAAEANDKYAVNDPNERYDVRPAPLSHRRWQVVYPHNPLPAELHCEDVEDDNY